VLTDRSSRAMSATLLAVLVIVPSRAVTGQATPGAGPPVSPAQPSGPCGSTNGGQPCYTADDVHFMQGMIAHHAQALAMTGLVRDRTTDAGLRLVAQRIEISQQDEIAMMRRWLESHHEEVPILDANHEAQMPGMDMPGMQMHGMMMPGMLTEEQMTQLANAKGGEFDRLFLEGMIQHHRGALVMVSDLFATKRAGQAPEIFSFASDIDADQRAEIKRMQAMLDAASAPVHHP
jgi:uncharacterized protein (DUF305 family)